MKKLINVYILSLINLIFSILWLCIFINFFIRVPILINLINNQYVAHIYLIYGKLLLIFGIFYHIYLFFLAKRKYIWIFSLYPILIVIIFYYYLHDSFKYSKKLNDSNVIYSLSKNLFIYLSFFTFVELYSILGAIASYIFFIKIRNKYANSNS